MYKTEKLLKKKTRQNKNRSFMKVNISSVNNETKNLRIYIKDSKVIAIISAGDFEHLSYKTTS